ncbi:hypothetical protein BCR39DRAFT_504120 [Naematelia encephala]|uniref:Uncharacterized protein n=1 Tax=Naematelia encephala TaxID=71784 RepID=A0A1Y2BD91_9TREE|nr:hypothetical protein BCR39DRAFT_504120 [Naematelia encephala]
MSQPRRPAMFPRQTRGGRNQLYRKLEQATVNRVTYTHPPIENPAHIPPIEPKLQARHHSSEGSCGPAPSPPSNPTPAHVPPPLPTPASTSSSLDFDDVNSEYYRDRSHLDPPAFSLEEWFQSSKRSYSSVSRSDVSSSRKAENRQERTMPDNTLVETALASIRRAMGHVKDYELGLPDRGGIDLKPRVSAPISLNTQSMNGRRENERVDIIKKDVQLLVEENKETHAEKLALQRALDEAVVQLHKRTRIDADVTQMDDLKLLLKEKDLALAQADSAIVGASSGPTHPSIPVVPIATPESEQDKGEVTRLYRKIEDLQIELTKEQASRKVAETKAMSATKHQSTLAKDILSANVKVAELEKQVDEEIKARRVAESKASQAEARDLKSKHGEMIREQAVAQARARSEKGDNERLVNKVKTMRGENDALQNRVAELLQQRPVQDKLQQSQLLLRQKLKTTASLSSTKQIGEDLILEQESQASRLLKEKTKLQDRVDELQEQLERDRRNTVVVEREHQQPSVSSMSPVSSSAASVHPLSASAGVRSIRSIPALEASPKSTPMMTIS